MRIGKERIMQWVAKYCVVRVGSNRVVLDFLRLGLVVKLPIVRFVLLVRVIKTLLFEGRICSEQVYAVIRLFTVPADLVEVGGVRPWLLKGVVDNWREFWFFAVERHPFACPTYFSLFGLVAIQKKGSSLKIGREEFGRRVKAIIGEEKFYSDGHHFSNPTNFSFSGGRLQMVDYGSVKTRKVIRSVGMCLYNNFRLDNVGE